MITEGKAKASFSFYKRKENKEIFCDSDVLIRPVFMIYYQIPEFQDPHTAWQLLVIWSLGPVDLGG